MREDKFAKSMVYILRARVIEAHIQFDKEAHHEVEVEIRNERVGVDVADAARVVGDVEDELWERY